MAYLVKQTPQKSPRKKASERGPITFDQFYEMVDDGVKADLLDGQIIRDLPAAPKHGQEASWTCTLIKNYSDALDLGETFVAPATVRLSQYQGPEPDVFFIRKDRLSIVNDKFVKGPPDLCVEVISKSSRQRDRGRKFVLYADHGVQEYWLIDSLRDTLEFYENVEGEWREIKPDDQGRLHSKVLPGFWLKPAWLAAKPLPSVLKILREILGEKFDALGK